MTRILVVEDEASYRDPLTYQLTREGYEVVAVATGTDAVTAYDEAPADIVLLDLMLPGLSGTEVCRELRKRGNVPIIMLTAKDSEIDKVVGLELGADDYVTKPYSYRELLARVRAVLRRRSDFVNESSDNNGMQDSWGGNPGAVNVVGQNPQTTVNEDDEDDILVGGPITMDVDRHIVMVRGEEALFPLKEFELLEYLLRNAGRVLTRGQLIDRVWGLDYVGDTKTLDVHVKRIRAKIEEDPSVPVLLTTVRGLGYKIASGG